MPEIRTRSTHHFWARGQDYWARGQALVGVAVVLVVVAVAGLVVAQLGSAAADRAAARTAADASALAAAVGGPVAAAEASRRNGAELESVSVTSEGAEVTVRVGRATASARAEAGSSPAADGRSATAASLH